jgi:uncharacterized RDD family membrane protein YckC
MALLLDVSIAWMLLFVMQILRVSRWVLDHAAEVTPAPWGTWFLACTTVALLFGALRVACAVGHGQSPGMDVLGLRVVAADRADRGALGLGRAVTRTVPLVLAVALPPAFAAGALAVIAAPAVLDPARRTLADRLAGTVVLADGDAAHARHVLGTTNVIPLSMEKHVAVVTSDPSLLPGRPEAAADGDRAR